MTSSLEQIIFSNILPMTDSKHIGLNSSIPTTVVPHIHLCKWENKLSETGIFMRDRFLISSHLNEKLL